jgi:hypothetical protein
MVCGGKKALLSPLANIRVVSLKSENSGLFVKEKATIWDHSEYTRIYHMINFWNLDEGAKVYHKELTWKDNGVAIDSV